MRLDGRCGHMHYIYCHPPDPSAAAMTTLFKRFIARWRKRKDNNQRVMHSRWGDMSITAPNEGSWNNMSPQSTTSQFGDEFPAGYTPEFFLQGHRPGDVDSAPAEQGKSRMRCLLERLRLRTSEPEQPTPSMSKPQDTFARHHGMNSNKSSSSTRSPRRVACTPISREDLAIVNHPEPEREEMTTPTPRKSPSQQSDEDSVICPTEISDTESIDTFPNIIRRPISPEGAGHHRHSCDGVDRIFDGTFEPRGSTLTKGTTATRSSPGLASTAFMRSSSQNKHNSMETAMTKSSTSSHYSSPGLAATAFMRSSSRTRRHLSNETPATSVTSSPIMTTQSKEKGKRKDGEKRASQPEMVGKQELVPSFEELFG